MKSKTIVLVIILIFVIAAIYTLEQSKVAIIDEEMPVSEKVNGLEEAGKESASVQEQPLIKDGKYPLAPELVGITGYINAEEGLQIKDFRGKVVLIDFWTYSCINCIRTLPHLTAWDKKYKDKGLVIIGVHTPEFEFEKDTENVKNAMEKYGIEYKVVQDNNYQTWRAFKNRFWPHKYLIDSEGYIRYDHIGEGKYEETEKVIQELLAEIDQDVEGMPLTSVADTTPFVPTTPELYAGYGFALPRGQNIGNKEGLQPGKEINYPLPAEIKEDIIYVEGLWKSNEDNLEAKGTSSILLNFIANDVNIVADNLDKSVEVEIFVNEKYITKEQAGKDVQFKEGRSFIIINEPRLYNVVDGEYGRYTLKLTTDEGFTFHAFTFG